jgi:hypothetical protein
MVVDGTECPVAIPVDKQSKIGLCSTRNKDNSHGLYNLKYTVCVHIQSGKICAILGPDRGKNADISALRKHQHLLKLKEGELLLADKGYQGHERCLSGFKSTKKHQLNIDDLAFNETLDSVRQIVECTLKRLKDFGALGSAGRWKCSWKKHAKVFNVCAQITNLMLERDPVWLKINKLL